MIDGTTTRIGRARIRGTADPALARLRLGSLLAGAELRPRGLPPAAVLCVRRIADPLPGALRLDQAGTRAPPEWERAFIAVLDEALRSAARPAREAVPAGAEAVVFADRAELLACLAHDMHDGTAWTSWWWSEVRAAASGGGDPILTAWLETPEHVPAALELLAARGEATRFASSLPAPAAIELVERVAIAFAAPQLRATVRAGITTAGTAASGADTARAGAPPSEPPWRSIVPESALGAFAPAAELLVGVGLTLRRSPAVAHSRAFAAETRVWLAAVCEPEPATSPAELPAAARASAEHGVRPAGRQPTQAHDRVESMEIRATTEPPAQPDAPKTDTSSGRPSEATTSRREPPTATRRVGASERTEKAQERVAAAARKAPAARVAEQLASAVDGDVRVEAPTAATRAPSKPRSTPARPRVALTAAPMPLASDVSLDLPATVVDTELGGVFYLLNLALFLELYGDFSRPLDPGLTLSPWDLLALLGPKLLADPSLSDPLWPLLARLAGRRRRERPGANFRPPPAWRGPAAWLEPFDHDGAWLWSAARGALRIVHPAGFPAVAVPRRDEAATTQLARELRRLRPISPSAQRASLPREPVQPLARWVSRLAAYADARLRRALDLDPDVALDTLLRRRARIFVTPTHVDVVLRLADLPLEVRYAGLDRTPGWIPAAGRYVALHFE